MRSPLGGLRNRRATVTEARSEPCARYARTLDGRHLWLAVEADHDAQTRIVLQLPNGELVDLSARSEDGLLVVLADLAGVLEGRIVGARTRVLVARGLDAPRPIRFTGGHAGGPALATPAADPGASVHRVVADAGYLVLGQAAGPDGVTVVRLFLTDDLDPAVAFSVSGGQATLRTRDGAEVPATLRGDSLVLDEALHSHLVPGTPYIVHVNGLPALRRRNCLTNPGDAVVLPRGSAGDVVLTWNRRSRLVVRKVALGPSLAAVTPEPRQVGP